MKREGDERDEGGEIVAPCAGAWIETSSSGSVHGGCIVAPCAGAWIETSNGTPKDSIFSVAPCAGAWIETSSTELHTTLIKKSPPSRGRGLKLGVCGMSKCLNHVAPCAGGGVKQLAE